MKTLKLFLTIAFVCFSTGIKANNNIKVDQFGYLPSAIKVAVISQSNVGKFSPESYSPGTTFEVRKVSDNSAIFSGSPVAWNSGLVHDQSGDKVWHFDFSTVTTEGEYYVYDVTNDKKSYNFRIANNVYDDALKAATRVFYYQRRSTDKPAQYAGIDWQDGMAFLNSKQDAECMLYGSSDVSTKRDLRGGWFDAGDYNQYITFTVSAMTDLLKAYQLNPSVWGDSNNIPESGNGIPDLLDEIKWELDWMLRMQNTDGSVLSVKGEPANIQGATTPPSTYKKEQRYGPATTAASYTAAAVLALASKVYASIKQTSYSQTLRNAAINAYQWAEAHPSVKFSNSGKLCAGENQPDDNGVTRIKLIASIYLFDLTGENSYKTLIDSKIDSWSWISMFESEMNDAWLTYYNAPEATTDVKNKIKTKFVLGVAQNSDYLSSYSSNADAYRAFMRSENYTWGSNKTKSAVANTIINLTKYGIQVDSALHYNAAQGYLNYMHGANALDLCFVTNMSAYGAENSANQIYHTWFDHGSKWSANPPPGYIPGGPNKYYKLDNCCPSGCGSSQNNVLCNNADAKAAIGQPTQKCYANINDSWPVNSWEITEPGIYYQAAYVRLVSSFVVTSQSLVIPEDLLKYSGSLEVGSIKSVTGILYPNPTTGVVRLNYQGFKKALANIYTLSGTKVKEFNITDTADFSLDLSDLSPGSYCIEVVESSTGGRKGSNDKIFKYIVIKIN